MKQNLIAAFAGLLFGLGLALSQMTDPARVLGFLDLAGIWDPTLIFVLGGAVGITVVTFRFILRRANPYFAPAFRLPTKTDIDRPLIVGAGLFGIGWGIAGYCPGPGITALVQGIWNPILFVTALFVGSFLYDRFTNPTKFERQSERQVQTESVTSTTSSIPS